MMLFTDGSNAEFMNPTNLTPAARYIGTTDLSVVLNDISRGIFPVNTQQPFLPLKYKSDPDDNKTPWIGGY